MRRSRGIIVLVLIICYAALFYAVVHTRAPRSSAEGPPMCSALVSELGERRAGISSKPYARNEDHTSDPPRQWIFPAIDIWPNPPGWSATMSEFTPVTDTRPAQATQQDHLSIGKVSARRPVLTMTRWLRLDYPAVWAEAGTEGAVLLELRIAPSGEPSDIRVEHTSASRDLDDSAASVARRWRFAPPLWNAHPVEVWAQVQVRYHRSGDGE